MADVEAGGGAPAAGGAPPEEPPRPLGPDGKPIPGLKEINAIKAERKLHEAAAVFFVIEMLIIAQKLRDLETCLLTTECPGEGTPVWMTRVMGERTLQEDIMMVGLRQRKISVRKKELKAAFRKKML